MARARQRWLPALLIPVALAIALMFGSVQAGASVSLPPKSAEEILALIAHTEVRALSGTVKQDADLGLPELPASDSGIAPGASSGLEFLTGSHTARVYVDGPRKARLQILDQMAERDVIVNGGDAWFYSSKDNSATHLSLPPTHMQAQDMQAQDMPTPDMPTPATMASRFLAAVNASTEVTVSEASSVAGRSVYSLILNPRSSETLVESVSIDVDSETGLPLGIEVRAKGQSEPAYSLAYTQLDLSTPDPSLFQFTPPQGATVTEKAAPAKPTPTMTLPAEPIPDPGVTGQGWDSVISLPAGSVPAGFASDPQLSQALQAVDGGRAVTTSLLSVLILDDGRVYAGMVPLERLQSVAAAR